MEPTLIWILVSVLGGFVLALLLGRVFLLFLMVAFSFVLFYHRTAKCVNGCAQNQVLKGFWHLSPNFGHSTQNPGHTAK